MLDVLFLTVFFILVLHNFISPYLEVGVSTLKQLALTKGNFVPSLNSLVPYLDHTANQEYLRKRIRGSFKFK